MLKFRPRSKQEIYQRLKKRKFSDRIIREVVDFLEKEGFIDDLAFARIWAESRAKKPYGPLKIKQELILKGVDKNIIEAQLDEVKKKHPEEDCIREIIQNKLKRAKGCDSFSFKRRIYGYLLRRGFSPGAVNDVLGGLCKRIN